MEEITQGFEGGMIKTGSKPKYSYVTVAGVSRILLHQEITKYCAHTSGKKLVHWNVHREHRNAQPLPKEMYFSFVRAG